MSDIFDERRRGLEEEYFRRQNQEALERLRAKRAAEGGPAHAAEPRHCPLGHGPLTEIAFEEVFVDRCEQCRGIWLDAGELEQLTARGAGEGSWLGRLFGGPDKG